MIDVWKSVCLFKALCVLESGQYPIIISYFSKGSNYQFKI